MIIADKLKNLIEEEIITTQETVVAVVKNHNGYPQDLYRHFNKL